MKLSIVTINYNNSLGLSSTIESVINQKWKEYEFIIIDGGSTDNSVEVIKIYERYISFWVSEADAGIYSAMNKGIAKAKGEYLLMLNSGDRLADVDVLSRIFNEQTHQFADIIYGNVKWLKEDELHLITCFPPVLTFQFFWYRSLAHQATFIKKSVHDVIGLYDEELKFCSDWKLFLLAICKFNLTYTHINNTISLCDCNGLSWNSSNFPIMKEEKLKVFAAHFAVFQDDYKELEAFKRNTLNNKYRNFKARVKENIKQTIKYKKK